jgi:hypothetical protein
MPQPLSSIVQGEINNFIIAPDAAAREPEIAALIAKAISICSESDYYLGRTLIDMLGSQAVPAFAVYEALAWGYARKQALKAAAAMSLEEQDYRIFEAVLKLYGQDEGQRNKFAHWLWCYSSQAPGHVILIDPLEALRWKIAPQVSPGVARTLAHESVTGLGQSDCYSKAELKRTVERFTETIGLIETFRNLVGVPGAPKDHLRESLETQPRMIEALRHPEKLAETLPSAPAQPPR